MCVLLGFWLHEDNQDPGGERERACQSVPECLPVCAYVFTFRKVSTHVCVPVGLYGGEINGCVSGCAQANVEVCAYMCPRGVYGCSGGKHQQKENY